MYKGLSNVQGAVSCTRGCLMYKGLSNVQLYKGLSNVQGAV